jgi:hypothetical protein
MGSPNGSIHTTHTPPPLSFYNTFKACLGLCLPDLLLLLSVDAEPLKSSYGGKDQEDRVVVLARQPL